MAQGIPLWLGSLVAGVIGGWGHWWLGSLVAGVIGGWGHWWLGSLVAGVIGGWGHWWLGSLVAGVIVAGVIGGWGHWWLGSLVAGVIVAGVAVAGVIIARSLGSCFVGLLAVHGFAVQSGGTLVVVWSSVTPMRISLNWLKELVAVDLSPEELAHRLTMAGFEVEDIEDRRTWADGVVVGRVLEREQHPNADRLSVCRVDVGGDAPLTIVCGAANVRADIFVAVATIGTYLPQIDLKLKPTKLRGVASEGMICSLAELGLEKESSGIHIFPQGEESEVEGDSLGVSALGVSLAVGQDVRPLLGLDDVILDVTSTANRADALSLVGIAREVRALTGAALHLPEVALGDYAPLGDAWAVGVREPKACSVYSGTLIEGVTVGVSPVWLQRRLQSAGVRPINNVVDVTNYVLLEWGQPLHAFDGDRLRQVAGAGLEAAVSDAAVGEVSSEAVVKRVTVGVRFARGGETLQTLDGQSRTLQEQSLVITAGSATELGSTDLPVALAGVMGGEDTEVHAGTRTVFLEAAWFDPVVTRRSARSQGLRTEASGRYERGVNPLELPLARQRALDLLLAIAGGTIVGQDGAQTLGETEVRTLTLRYERVIQVLGLVEQGEDLRDLEPAEVEQALTALGCTLTPLEPETKTWTVTIPPYRYRDLEREIDLIEEVARLYGYDNFCDTLPAKSELGMLSVDEKLCRILRQCLTGAGLTELIHYSLGKPERSAQVQLANPLLAEYSALRTDLLSGLIDAFQYNWDQGNGPLNGFELGRVFWSEEEGLHEADRLAGILGGDSMVGTWVRSGRSQPLTWYEAKGVLDSVLQRLDLSVEYQPDRQDKRLHPGRTASLWVQGERLGTLGQLHPQLVQERGLPDAVYAFELDLDVLLDALATRWEEATPFQPYSAFPASDRDLAFYVDRGVSVADLQRVMRKVGKPLLESAEVFDQYEGATVTEGRRSLAFRLVYRASDRTLTETDVDPIHQAVREALVEKYRVDLRS